MTLPAGTVALLCIVTVPRVRPAPVSAVAAAACVSPTTLGAATVGMGFVAVLSVLLQLASNPMNNTASARRCQCECLLKLKLAPVCGALGARRMRTTTIAPPDTRENRSCRAISAYRQNGRIALAGSTMGRCLRFCASRSKLARLIFSGSPQFFARSTSVDAPKYRAFISYSHRDSGWGSWLHTSLEKYRLPKSLIGTMTAHGEVPKRIAPIFRDRDELPSATDLGSLIKAALADSACQIVICSPQAAKSKWVNEEILAFKRLGREDRIFCLIVSGEPNATDIPGRQEEECFPPALRFRLRPDGELSAVRTEPIAADARPGKDGRSNAKLKIISGLLGVGFDTLRRREQQRRNRRLVAFSSAATAGMVLTSGLAAYALIQRAAAQRQTVRAEAEARTSQETTRFLVDLFKISDPSEARGNTVTAREMLDKGASRVDHELAKEPAIQARLMDTLGSVYMGLGLFNQARPMIDRAVATRRRLQGVDPLDLSDSLTHQSDLLG